MPHPHIREKEKLREEFIKVFPDMECHTEEQTAKVVADWWLEKIDQIFKREDDIADRLKRKFNGYGGRIGFTLHELLELVDKREELEGK